MAPEDEDGVRNPDEVPPVDVAEGASVEEATDGTTPRPKKGGPNFDVFLTPAGGEHLAVLYPEPVNLQEPDGRWVKAEDRMGASPWGWEAELEGVAVGFPAALGPESVRFEIPEGSLRTVPEGMSRGGARGAEDEHTILYPKGLTATDFRYRVSPHGYKEEAVLNGPKAPSTLAWEVEAEGLLLAPTEEGHVAILTPLGEEVGTIPQPVVYDSSEEIAEHLPETTLTQTTPTRYRLEVALDPAFLEDAVYPVLVDPGQITKRPSRDGYVNSASPNSSYESSIYLKVGQGKRTFIRFDTSAQQRSGRLVYDAILGLYLVSQGQRSKDVRMKRVSGSWPVSLTWNNQPETSGATYDGFTGPKEDWLEIDAVEIYQRYLSNVWPDRGVRLGSDDEKTFLSEDFGGAGRPVLFLHWNDFPSAPPLKGPADGAVLETESPTLRIDKIPFDANGDDVFVQFQVSDDPDSWTGDSLKWSSPWVDVTRQVVPAGVLLDGQTYYWRARSWDQCGEEPGEMCPRKDGTGTMHELNASNVRSFQVALERLGDDERWGMWSQDLGNDMALGVNPSTGNLFLDVPLDTLATPVDDLAISLTYNSQQAQDAGLGRGWDVSAGPASERRLLPRRLKDKGEDGIQIEMRDGGFRFFPQRSNRVYGGTGAGTVRKNADDTYTYVTPEGGTYTFRSGGWLDEARPAGTSDAYDGRAFSYQFSATNRLTEVKDALGRPVTFTWSGTPERLSSITAWDGRSWTLTYGAEDRLAALSTPAGETVGFSYTGEVLSGIRDGAHTADGDPGWRIAYRDDIRPDRTQQWVAAVHPPGAPPEAHWRFDHPQDAGDYRGGTAAWARITDPEGTRTADPNDRMTTIDFTWGGLPVRIAGPADMQGYLPVTTQVWDNRNNLLCRRSPAANAVAPGCSKSLGTEGALNTEYAYEDDPPYRLTGVTHPAPDAAGNGERATETYLFDQGPSYRGMWAELFNNGSMKGIPAAQRVWDDFDKNWGQGSAAGIDRTDHWSIRWTGILDLSEKNKAKKYKFRVFSDDGVTLTVGNSTLVDCFGDQNEYDDFNCGTNQTVSKKLWPGRRPITIEFQEKTDKAAFTLKWDKGEDSWSVMGTQYLRADTGLVTTERGDLAETKYDYPTNNAKRRRLPATETTTDLTGRATPVSRTTAHTYDQYGRPTEITGAVGTPQEATTTHAYDGACLVETVGPTGARTTQECNGAGDVIRETVHVRADGPQPAQDRTTETDHDAMGRVTEVRGPEGEVTRTAYDSAGRPERTSELVAGAAWAVTDREYDTAGRPVRELLPDPDDGGPLTRPEVTYEHDWTGAEVGRVDPRGERWETAYDAHGRVVAETSPSGLVSTTAYLLVDEAGAYANREVQTDPAGVTATTTRNVVGQVTRERVGTLEPTIHAHDVAGNVIKTTDPAGVWTEQDHDGFGQVTAERTPAPGGGVATTVFSYDAAGNLLERAGPLSNVDDRVTYAYDLGGQLTEATLHGITGSNRTHRFDHTDAGERLRVTSPGTGSQTFVREWTYDRSGREATFRLAPGTAQAATTSYSYNAAGWLTGVEDPRGITLRYAHDRLGRETRRWAETPQGIVGDLRFAYDPAGSLTRAEVVGGPVTEVSYDPDGRESAVTQGPHETTYAYDPATGELRGVADPAGETTFSYDGNGLLHRLGDPLTGGETTYSYDPAGRPISRTDPFGLAWTRDYLPSSGQVSSQVVRRGGTEVASFSLQWDAAGQVEAKESHVEGAPAGENGRWTYAYDGAGRMTRATDPSGVATTYSWDPSGNRTEVTVGSQDPVTTTYDPRGLPASSSDGATFTHDPAGNLTRHQGGGTDWRYAYDPWGKMTEARGALGIPTVAYAYDALGRQVSRTEGLREAAYAHRGRSHDHALVEEALGGVPQGATRYAWSGENTPLGQESGGEVRAFLRDLHGDVVGLAGDAGDPTGWQAYSPWGERRGRGGEESALGFQGDPTDPATGLVDMETRLYAPALGRFTSRDVIFGEPDAPTSLNQYLYGVGSPLTHWDPHGMDAWRVISGCTSWKCTHVSRNGKVVKRTTSSSSGGGSSTGAATYYSPEASRVTWFTPPRPAPMKMSVNAYEAQIRVRSVASRTHRADIIDPDKERALARAEPPSRLLTVKNHSGRRGPNNGLLARWEVEAMPTVSSHDPFSWTLLQCAQQSAGRERFGCQVLNVAYHMATWWVSGQRKPEPYDPSKGQFNPSAPDYEFYCSRPFYYGEACTPTRP